MDNDFSGLEPSYEVHVNGTKLNVGVTQLFEKVSYEDTDGVIDMLKINAKNPNGVLSDNKVLAIGNEVKLYGGYGNNLKFIGGAKIFKHRPFFQRDAMDTIEITGYTLDHQMMHNSPTKASPNGKSKGRRHVDQKYSQAVEGFLQTYKMNGDIDESLPSPTTFIQKAGMTDYEFINGLANITGFIFWVDMDTSGKWTLHFKNPEELKEQDSVFVFRRNEGNRTTLFDFEPTFLASEGIGHMRVRVLDAKSGTVYDAEFDEDNDDGSPELQFDGNPYVDSELIEKSPVQGQSVQIYIGDYTFYEISNRRFTSQADTIKWAKQWFRRNRENFIFAEGSSIGITGIRSRQVHQINGTGKMYDGLYYFSRVNHCFDENGYTLNFTCRKQTPKV